MFLNARRRRAPVVLFSFRSVLVAVFAAALLTSLAASSSPFVTTAAASEALKNRLAELTPFATGVQIQGAVVSGTNESSLLARARTQAAAARQLGASLGRVGSPVQTIQSDESSPVYVQPDATPVVLMNRTDALAHVDILSRTSGPGVWISSIVADTSHLKPGDLVHLFSFSNNRPLALRVKGVYRALAHSPEVSYWINFDEEIYPQDPNDPPPPSFVFMSKSMLFHTLLASSSGGNVRFGQSGVVAQTVVELPVNPAGLTLAGARSLEKRFGRVQRELHGTSLGGHLGCVETFQGSSCSVITSLSSAVILADGNAAAVTVPIGLLSDAGTAIALAVAAAAGAFLVRRRRAEVALAYARGEHVLAFAGQTAVEAFLPALLGGAAGFGLALGLTGVFAPSGSTDPDTVTAALAHGAVAVAVGLVLLVGAASLAFLRLYDTGVRAHRWLRVVPWELPLIGIAIYLLVRIDSGHGLAGSAANGSAHPTLAVFVFPLLLVAGAAGLAARLGRLVLRLSSRRAGRTRSIPVYLAVRRLAAARGLLVVLAVVSAVSLGAFCYAEALAGSLSRTTTEKAYMATGSDAEAEVVSGTPAPSRFPYPITEIEFSNQNAAIDTTYGEQIDVMLVDPATIAGAIHWESDWGANPAKLLHELATAPANPLPVIVTSGASKLRRLAVEGGTLPVKILGTVRAFPEETPGIPLVITSVAALNKESARAKVYDPLGVMQSYMLVKGPPLQAERALTASSIGVYYPSSIETFLHDPNVELATRTFSFMRTIAIAAAVLVLLGLLLYLQARQRGQVIASALAGRMGFGGRAQALSITVELAAILGFAAVLGGGIATAAAGPVVRHIDPLPQDSPSPIFTLPTVPLIVAAVCLVVVAIAAGALTSWLAGRADVSEELRVA